MVTTTESSSALPQSRGLYGGGGRGYRTKRRWVGGPGPVPTPVFRIVFSRVALSADRSGGLAGLMALVSVGCLAATVAPRLHLSLPLADGRSCSVGTRIKFFITFFYFNFFVCYAATQNKRELGKLQHKHCRTAYCPVQSVKSLWIKAYDVIFTFFLLVV